MMVGWDKGSIACSQFADRWDDLKACAGRWACSLFFQAREGTSLVLFQTLSREHMLAIPRKCGHEEFEILVYSNPYLTL